jgi:hypothetical protein
MCVVEVETTVSGNFRTLRFLAKTTADLDLLTFFVI